MAEQLKEFEWSTTHGRKGQSKYNQFMDGNVWKIDYRSDSKTSSVEGLQASLMATAKRKQLPFRLEKVDEHYVVFQITAKERE